MGEGVKRRKMKVRGNPYGILTADYVLRRVVFGRLMALSERRPDEWIVPLTITEKAAL